MVLTEPESRAGFTNPTAKQTYLLLAAILLLALILRIVALLSLKESIYFDYLLWDERLYHNWAMKIANGTFQSSSVYEMAPLPAYFMAFIYRLFSPDVIYVRIVNIILGVLTCYSGLSYRQRDGKPDNRPNCLPHCLPLQTVYLL